MNEEEKEAIEYIKAFQKDLYGASEKNLMAIYIDRVWNYIDKLQEGNEYLKQENSLLGIQEILDNFYERKDKIEKYYVSKDKIREKIKYLETKINVIPPDNEYTYREVIEMGIDVLEELLKEE